MHRIVLILSSVWVLTFVGTARGGQERRIPEWALAFADSFMTTCPRTPSQTGARVLGAGNLAYRISEEQLDAYLETGSTDPRVGAIEYYVFPVYYERRCNFVISVEKRADGSIQPGITSGGSCAACNLDRFRSRSEKEVFLVKGPVFRAVVVVEDNGELFVLEHDNELTPIRDKQDEWRSSFAEWKKRQTRASYKWR